MTTPHKQQTRTTGKSTKELDLAEIATRFLCHRLGIYSIVPTSDRDTIVQSLNTFIGYILHETNPDKDAVLGALVILDRTRNLRAEFFKLNVDPSSAVRIGQLFFTCFLGIACNAVAGNNPPPPSQVIKDPELSKSLIAGPWDQIMNEICNSAQEFWQYDSYFKSRRDPDLSDPLMPVEVWVLNHLKGDILLEEELFRKFKERVVLDFGGRANAADGSDFPYYPRSFVTKHPVFLR